MGEYWCESVLCVACFDFYGALTPSPLAVESILVQVSEEAKPDQKIKKKHWNGTENHFRDLGS